MGEKLLGRGLKDLFVENNIDEIRDGEVIVNISLDEIKPNPFQPRKIFNQEKIDELASSIKEYGVFQPIIIKPVAEGYIIVSGERRYRAANQVGLQTIPAIIRQYDPGMVREIALLENLQREDLTPIEEAEAYKDIIDELMYTQKELADKIGKSRSYVTNILGLLNLPKKVQQMILDNQISMGHARVLSKLENEDRIIEIANLIVKNELSVRQVEELGKKEKKTKQIKRTVKNPYKKYEKTLKSKYGYNVSIKNNKITFKADDNELDELIKKLLEE